MRIGHNPQKDKIETPHPFFHQVVVPVYIPNEEGYFKDSLSILKNCLESILKTSHGKTFFTVVNNGSCPIVVSFLDNLKKEQKIHELIHTENIGKINAVFKGLMGHEFPLVTIVDADVLFLNGWQEETYQIFEEFPKTGCVSPSPIPKLLKYHTYGPIMGYLFSKKLQFKSPKNPKALKSFAHSIGNSDFYKEVHLKNVLTLEGIKTNAVLGSGHFVATYRADIFKGLKKTYSSYKLGGNSDGEFFDVPVENNGYWRLSTENNYALHLGNVLEPWMEETLKKIENQNNGMLQIPSLTNLKRNRCNESLKKFIFQKFIARKPIWVRFLQAKGLSEEDSLKY